MPEDQKAGPEGGALSSGDDASKLALTGLEDAAPEGGDAGRTETPEAELARLREAHKQSLGEKQKLEQATRRVEDLERAEAARAAATSTAVPANVDAYAMQRAQQAQRALAEAQLLANANDPLAQLILLQDQVYGQELRNMRLEVEAGKVPESYREDVKAALQSGKYADAQAALKAVKAEKDIPARDSEIERLKRENESLRRAEDARKAGVVGAGRSVPDLSGQRGAEPRNETEFNQEMSRLERAGDPKARAELSRRYRKMELPFQHRD